MSNKILVSLVITARNDNYTKGFIDRLIYTVNYNLQKVHEIKSLKKFEIIIVDWGSEKRISEIFKLKNKKFLNRVKFFYIDPKKAKKYGKSAPGSMFQELIMNIGLRRSLGKVKIIGTHDVVYSLDGWSNIFRISESKEYYNKFFWVPKKFIDMKFYLKSPSFEDLDKHLENIYLTRNNLDSYSYYSGGGASSLMFSAELDRKIYGLSENLANIGRNSLSDLDIAKKASIYGKFKDSLSCGIIGFKFPQFVTKNTLKKKFASQKLTNKFYFPSKFKNKDYGLKSLVLKADYAKLIDNHFNILIKNKNFFLKNNIPLFENFLSIIKTYVNTIHFPLNLFDFSKLKINKFLIRYINSTRTFSFILYGLNETHLLGTLCKNFCFMNIQILEYEKVNNSTIFSSKLDTVNRYYNLNHKSLYNYTYTKDINIISNYIKKEKLTQFSSIALIDSKNFSKIMINNIISKLNEQNDKISLLIIKKNETNFENKKIASNYNLITKIDDYFIFFNKKIKSNDEENFSKLFNISLLENISYSIIAYSIR